MAKKMSLASCKACGAPIGFIKTVFGKTVPVDAESKLYIPDPKGKDMFVLPDGTTERGWKVNVKGEATKIGYISHFATCPEADKFRKRTKKGEN